MQFNVTKRTEKFNSKANLAEAEVITIVISSEVSMVANMKDWVVDSRATKHICGNRSAFTSYTTVNEGEEQVFMISIGTSVSISAWKAGVRILFDSDKIVLTKNDAFVGKGYCPKTFDAMFIGYAENSAACSDTPNGCQDAFLNGDLEEEIYMEQPKGCVVPRKEKKVLYLSKYEDNTCVVICLYVDDMLIFRTSLEVVVRPRILSVTPYDPSSQLKKNKNIVLPNARIIKSLMYLMNCTKPDIAYAVDRVYTTLTKVEYLLLLNTIFLMGGTCWVLRYGEAWSGYLVGHPSHFATLLTLLACFLLPIPSPPKPPKAALCAQASCSKSASCAQTSYCKASCCKTTLCAQATSGSAPTATSGSSPTATTPCPPPPPPKGRPPPQKEASCSKSASCAKPPIVRPPCCKTTLCAQATSGSAPPPPVVHPPPPPVVHPPPPPTPCPPPPPPKGRPPPQQTCPIDTLKLVLQGLVDLDAAVCLCTAIKVKLLNVNIIIPIALQVLVGCGKTPPSGFQCPAKWMT
ncbi:36.4 kDa proline-rich protein [Vitis vinifera]|uniref:36.4 kDa proline-rich protein n=1 Tax=Vitis vinifera TaxID=29760 RepID=A0A438J3N5_VITVI|nr:36.4 kDa proline-rich protein [Vitis vinifera]